MSGKLQEFLCCSYVEIETSADGYDCAQAWLCIDVLFCLSVYFFAETCCRAEMRFAYPTGLQYLKYDLPARFVYTGYFTGSALPFKLLTLLAELF